MTIGGICDDCGGETEDYFCYRCQHLPLEEEVEKLRAENVELRAEIERVKAELKL